MLTYICILLMWLLHCLFLLAPATASLNFTFPQHLKDPEAVVQEVQRYYSHFPSLFLLLLFEDFPSF